MTFASSASVLLFFFASLALNLYFVHSAFDDEQQSQLN